MSSDKKLFVVFGASGAQGGAVIKAFLKDAKLTQQYRVRGLVHDANSNKAKKLIEQGIEVKQVNLNDRASIRQAVDGAKVVFGLTILAHTDKQLSELEQGKLIVDASKEAGVDQFIYGALPNAKKISGGKWAVEHFTQKAEIQEYAKLAGFKYTGFPCPPFYFENFIHYFKPVLQGDEWVFNLPNTRHITTSSIEDIGPVTIAILSNPEEYNGVFVPLVAEQGTPAYFAEEFAQAFGVKAKANVFPIEYLKQQSVEFYEMFSYFDEFDYYGPNVDKTIQLKALPHPTKFRDWLKQQKIESFAAPKKENHADPTQNH